MQMDGDDMMVAEGFKIGIQLLGIDKRTQFAKTTTQTQKKCNNCKYEIVRTMKNNLAYLPRFLAEQSEVEKPSTYQKQSNRLAVGIC